MSCRLSRFSFRVTPSRTSFVARSNTSRTLRLAASQVFQKPFAVQAKKMPRLRIRVFVLEPPVKTKHVPHPRTRGGAPKTARLFVWYDERVKVSVGRDVCYVNREEVTLPSSGRVCAIAKAERVQWETRTLRIHDFHAYQALVCFFVLRGWREWLGRGRGGPILLPMGFFRFGLGLLSRRLSGGRRVVLPSALVGTGRGRGDTGDAIGAGNARRGVIGGNAGGRWRRRDSRRDNRSDGRRPPRV